MQHEVGFKIKMFLVQQCQIFKPSDEAFLIITVWVVQKQSRRCSVKKVFLEISFKFTGKHLCQSLFLIKLQAEFCNFIKKENLAQVLSYEFCKISKNTFSYRIHLPAYCGLIQIRKASS